MIRNQNKQIRWQNHKLYILKIYKIYGNHTYLTKIEIKMIRKSVFKHKLTLNHISLIDQERR
jgi:hypothetical protein